MRVLPVDTTIEKLNNIRVKPLMIKKMLPFLPIGATGGVGQGFQIAPSQGPFGFNLTFDPAGTVGNFGYSGPSAIPEWTAYSGLYQFYRVKKIKLIFSAEDSGSGGLLNSPPVIHIRYNNDYIPITPTRSVMAGLSKVIKKTFTPEHPFFTYSIYPKVQQLVDNYGSALSAESRVPKSMPWTNTATPVQLYGVSIYQSGTATGQWLNIDCEYDLEFKSQY